MWHEGCSASILVPKVTTEHATLLVLVLVPALVLVRVLLSLAQPQRQLLGECVARWTQSVSASVSAPRREVAQIARNWAAVLAQRQLRQQTAIGQPPEGWATFRWRPLQTASVPWLRPRKPRIQCLGDECGGCCHGAAACAATWPPRWRQRALRRLQLPWQLALAHLGSAATGEAMPLPLQDQEVLR
mmetsp:Transcript_16698/g.53316  ORF Transcript_16698/g.53316 Transcript_16698/m.53316 type:complete len:187 (+) Transcript_16698:271-831(+)